jgi:O-acetyl-ADP-ribose deacetylase (regulator of RNase III)
LVLLTMKFNPGNLLDAPAQALVHTVNTVGGMGKGIALMSKEAFPQNFRADEDACKQKEVQVGKRFVMENRAFSGPRSMIKFPTKKQWRPPSKLEWIIEGPGGLRKVVQEDQIHSIVLSPFGAGNGGA